MRSALCALLAAATLSACGATAPVGRAPALSPINDTPEHFAMMNPGLPETLDRRPAGTTASLWSAGQRSLLGDQRAAKRGDILTVVIEIDDQASMSNSSERSRSGSENMGVGAFFGLPAAVGARDLDPGVGINSTSQSAGDGSVQRNEELELRVAATVIDVLRNGTLAIQGTQEVRVNSELRELLVTGYVRPADISRRNEITYDKIASARISYGGRGSIADAQSPRYGQQVLDRVLPF